MAISIDSIVQEFDGKYGIPASSTDKYIAFVRAQSRQAFVNKKEALDLTLLLGYVTGDRAIVDRNTGKGRKIRKGKPEDLVLLNHINVEAKDEKGQRYNPELYRLRGRFNGRHHVNKDSLNYGQALDRLFKDKRVKEHLGRKASHALDVCSKPYYNEKDDLEKLMNYVLGRKSVIDRETGRGRRIRKGKPEDLVLLNHTNVGAKDKKGQRYNPELSGLLKEFSRRHSKDKRSLNYGQALNKIFKDKRVKKYLGRGASYDLNVKSHSRDEKNDLEKLMNYVLGRKSIVDNETGKERRIRKEKLEDLALLSLTNINYKNEEDQRYNLEPYRIWARFSKRHSRNKRSLNYGQALNRIFRKEIVRQYFGKMPSYKKHVALK